MLLKYLKSYKLKKAIYTQDDELNDILTGYEDVATIQADIQPASGKEKIQLYGRDIINYMTVFCYANPLIEEGLYIEKDGLNYRIMPIQKWQHWTFDIEGIK